MDSRRLDESAGGAQVGPIGADAAGPFGELGVVAVDLEDMVQVVFDGIEIAGGELRVRRAGMEEGRRRRHIVERRHHFIEVRDMLHFFRLTKGESHGYAHPEVLRHLERRTARILGIDGILDEITVGERLEPQVAQKVVALRHQEVRYRFEVEVEHPRVELLQFHAALHVRDEPFAVLLLECPEIDSAAERFFRELDAQEARGEDRVHRVAFDHRTHDHNERAGNIFSRDAFVHFDLHLLNDHVDVDAGEVAPQVRERFPDLLDRECLA